MKLSLHRFPLTKAVPLAISRGSSSGVEHLLVQLEQSGCTGIGETGSFDTGHQSFTTEAITTELQRLSPRLASFESAGEQVERLDTLLDWAAPLLADLSPPARCGIDLALHDWWGKRMGEPLHRLWGLAPDTGGDTGVATSVTLGLGSVEAVLVRLERWWLQLPATRIKLKLGSPDGTDHDRALVQAVRMRLNERDQQTGTPHELQVDANGGWDLQAARKMAPWLVEQGVVLLEQPLPPNLDPVADTAGFAALRAELGATPQSGGPLPLVADESCWSLADLERLAPHVDGINIKLLKCGGLAEARRMALRARQLGLQVMLGCYGDGSLLNGAATQLLPLVQWPDLDSHLNLINDPFTGLERRGDVLFPPRNPGLGIRWQGESPAPGCRDALMP